MEPSPSIDGGTGTPLRIGIVAGEASGDILGGRLMAAIRRREPDVRFAGVGGKSMLAEGLDALAPLAALSVNGFKDPLLRLPSLYQLLHRLRRHFVAEHMDAVVGVDFNVFNLLLERAVRKRGIPTAHYVSPSVYFWRPGRIDRIAKAADVVLALFPFEPDLYAARGARAVFVGHPLADEIDPADGTEEAKQCARKELGVPADRRVIALLPGSRRSEIDFLGCIFLDTAARLHKALEEPIFLVPTPTLAVHDAVQAILANWSNRAQGEATQRDMDVRLVRDRSRAVIAAADAVLVKSGTGTLETMLLRRPMVVSYRMGALTVWIIRRLKKSDFIALPNILAGRELVPELVQEDAEPSRLAAALIEQHRRCQADSEYLDACAHWHERLRQGGAGRAAEAVLSLVRQS